jgi:uncharacterized membrane protein
MSWSTRFRVRQHLKGSLWVTPLLGGLLGVLFGSLGALVDVQNGAFLWQYSPSTASAVLAAIVGAVVALTGFVLTVSVLMVQMATGTFSARYLRVWYRDRMLKALLAVLVGTLTFSFALLRRVEANSVPNLGVTLAGLLVAVSLLLFLLYLDRFLHRMRPVAIAALVAKQGRRAFLAATAAADAGGPEIERTPLEALGGDPVLVVRAGAAGSIQAVQFEGLVRWAGRHDSVLVFPHAVGDFVPAGDVLVEVFGDADPEADVRRLLGMVALGIERTIEQDPAFAVRIMVDVAVKALSPAVNDPTTAVQVLDHLEDTLRLIGTTDIRSHTHYTDGEGRVRLLVPARRWEDYLALGVTEIREYGASAIQVTRRLRAALEELLAAVRPEYRSAVEDELARLDASLAQHFAASADPDRAGTADRQGIGGPPAGRQEPAISRASDNAVGSTRADHEPVSGSPRAPA